ncbi:hypothetical protein MKK70_09945 [Methylobacterium sp. E-041]|uniref:hypothetical protein n=1 Tax=Methylobacterium sp. E-041 TaxID=2836573 RepID=UPI001FBA7C84|nr:hypothetical protein [Methylobacterium sp. E-041]MCJ2105688.1 hypothetical protein [Methylobacterium sp. E-041]
MQNLLTRLGRLETAIIAKPPSAVRRFMVQGPHGLSAGDAATFLRERGHPLDAKALNIIRVVVGAEDGRPTDLPLKDLTPEQLR